MSMNDLQKKEFEILKEFITICKNNGINYYLVCGSALGAAKYGGFIPWDDDVDVALLRDDYERFLSVAPAQLPDGMFLQNFHTQKSVPFIYSKIRLSNTTFIEKSAAELDINHGVYIDVFPLDGYPKKKLCGIWFELKKQILRRIISSVYVPNSRLKKIVMLPIRVLILRDRLGDFVEKYDRLIRKYKISESDMICNFGNSALRLEYSPKMQYNNGAAASFEGLDVVIPENYDEYLTQKYGDWRADLPPEQQVGHHYAEIIDLQRPYTDYIDKQGGKVKIKF